MKRRNLFHRFARAGKCPAGLKGKRSKLIKPPVQLSLLP
jgi:hypothetical protein